MPSWHAITKLRVEFPSRFDIVCSEWLAEMLRENTMHGDTQLYCKRWMNTSDPKPAVDKNTKQMWLINRHNPKQFDGYKI